MTNNREEAARLADKRRVARESRDFAESDKLRDRVRELGFDIKDAPGGYELIERPTIEVVDARNVPTTEVVLDASVHVLYEGFRDDLTRFLEATDSEATFEIVVTDNASDDGPWLDALANERVRVLHFGSPSGWGESRNAAARTSRGAHIVFADLSVEPTGDLITPLIEALDDPSVGICGGWGLVTADLREFQEAPGPAVDAVEGYLLALRRDVFFGTGFDPWFKWYRHADLDLSFRVRAQGFAAVCVSVPAARHTHRAWASVPEPERSTRSKRNFYRFLDHWKDRTDLLVGGAPA